MTDISILKTKADLSGGEWVEDIQDQPGLRLKVRSIRYKPYRIAVSSKFRKAGKAYQTDEGALEAGVALGEPLAKHILVDWDMSKATGTAGLTDDGKPLSFSEEVAVAILTADDDFGIGQDLRDAVWNAASTVAERLAASTAEAVGN